jgi:general secretion pathway protein G
MRGFTLIELLIVVAIVALLASLAAPLAELGYQRGKEQELRQALREIRGALDAHKRAADEGQIEKKADASGYPPTLATLVEGVEVKDKAQGGKVYFLRRIPKDPLTGEEWGVRSYASPADSPQPGKDVFDVYSRSDDVGLNRIPYRDW